MRCKEVASKIHLYLDGELPPPDTVLLETHLVGCEKCRAEYESLVSVVETVRAAQPLYKASEESLRRVEQMVRRHQQRTTIYRGAIAASILIAVIAGAWSLGGKQAERDPFADFAAESHLRYERAALPLDVESSEPHLVAGWLSNRLPFHLTLPNYPELPGQPKKYTLVGARLVQYREEEVAFLAYRMDDRPISLLIASSSRIQPVAGEVYRSGGLSFRSTSRKGLRMITWVDKGLTYSLVSDLDAVGAESCVICHGGEGERTKFAPLNPRL